LCFNCIIEKATVGMNRPNFLCIGAQKAGTTFLFDILKRHPDIYLPEAKELHFFDRDEEYDKGILWYQDAHFKGAENHKCIGEVTPSYIFFESVPERILKDLGSNIKFIILLRNPVDRAYSHYWMQFKRKQETLPFMEALKLEPERTAQGYFGKTRFSYVSRGFYSEQIRRYLNYFSLNNMKFVIFEEFIQDIPRKIGEILNFLSCSQYPGTEGLEWNKVNSSKLKLAQYFSGFLLNRQYVSAVSQIGLKRGYPSMRLKYRKILAEIFRNDIRTLESLIHKDLSLWENRLH